MTTKTLYYIIGVLLLVVIGLAVGWYLTAGLAGGGIVAALTSWIKKEQKLKEQTHLIEEEARRERMRVENAKKDLLEKSKKAEKKDNSIVEGKSDDFRNNHLDKLADEFKSGNN